MSLGSSYELREMAMEAGASGRRRRRVVVAEANMPVRHELCELLSLMDDVEVVGRATNGAEAVQLASVLDPDVAILDLEMSHIDGFAAAALIREQLPECLLVALTVHGSEQDQEDVRRAGFDFCVAMDAPPATLLEVIRSALAESVPSPDSSVGCPGSPLGAEPRRPS